MTGTQAYLHQGVHRLGQDADDHTVHYVQPDGAPDDTRRPAETALPEGVPQCNYGRAARGVVLGWKSAVGDGLYPRTFSKSIPARRRK